MSVSGEKLNLLIMRDSGETKRFRVKRSYFRFVISFFLFCPIVAIIAFVACFKFWQDKAVFEQRAMVAEELNSEYEVKLKRLTNLEKLLAGETNLLAKITQNAVKNDIKNAQVKEAPRQITETKADDPAKIADIKSDTPEVQVAEVKTQKQNLPPEQREGDEEVLVEDGPGHAEFPVVDLGTVLVENVQSRLVEPTKIRTSLDLRNPGGQTIAGEVVCILSLASGETVPLTLIPANVGNYKISRWKKAVLFANVPEGHDLHNAQMVVEVKDQAGKLLYRNLFALEQ